MKATPAQIGRVVVSAQGHDQGRWYAVVAVVDEHNLQLCDGRYRTLKKPKLKKTKHVRSLPLTVEVCGVGRSGGALDDSDIRYQLRKAQNAYETQTSSATAQNKKEECAFVQK